ncbi:MAG: hypothetical protein M1830_006578 [Pleopsidium flavum]|nr:MAG: hypothetical protein M1830_006578 [Pleopsidium flavum]
MSPSIRHSPQSSYVAPLQHGQSLPQGKEIMDLSTTRTQNRCHRSSTPVYPVHPERPSMSCDFGSMTATSSAQLDPSTQKDRSKGINTMTGIVGGEPTSQEFFGSSSAKSFMRQVKSAIDAKVASPDSRPSSSVLGKAQTPTLSSDVHRRGTHVKDVDYVLPSRKTANNLTDVYWRVVHPLYPFLDRQDFDDAYQSIWSGSPSNHDERMLMCTVNVMFALSCQLSESIQSEQREASAKVYFKRAQDLLNVDLWDVGSTELIQCLLLMGQYLQSTNSPHQCWMIIGLAVRVAQGLGFHLPKTSFDFQCSRERELARRIWHGCVLMDRVLSMTFGRPAMITKSSAFTVPLPAMIDDEFLSHQPGIEVAQPANRPSMMAFFVKTLQLYEIINDLLLALYMGRDENGHKDQYDFFFGQSDSGDIATVYELDRALMTWGQTLPLHLRLSSPESSRNNTFMRQAIVLRASILHARILLFRPILSRFCLPQETPTDPGTALDESLPQRMALQCSSLCLRAAHDAIELIYANLVVDGARGPLPAWWYYVYTAATVLLAARLRPVIEMGASDFTIASSWAHALEILKCFAHFGSSAQRCVAALEILSEKVSAEASSEEVSLNPSTSTWTTAPSTSAPGVPDTSYNEFMSGFDSRGIVFDLNDMSWLNSTPGNL